MRSDGLLVTTPGLTDTIVVATKDVVLVADKAHDQQVKDVAQRLRVTARSEASAHPVVFRPWEATRQWTPGQAARSSTLA